MKVKLTDGFGQDLAEFEVEITDVDATINGSGASDGNVFIEVDGTSIGSMWFRNTSGEDVIEFGGYDEDGDWTEADVIAVVPSREDGSTVRDF